MRRDRGELWVRIGRGRGGGGRGGIVTRRRGRERAVSDTAAERYLMMERWREARRGGQGVEEGREWIDRAAWLKVHL